MSFTTARIYCTISPPLSGAMTDCSILHSPGSAAANALSLKVLYVRVTTHVRLAVEHRITSIGDKTAGSVNTAHYVYTPNA